MINPGDRFGRLTVIEHAGRAPSRHALLKCRCDCGTVRVFRSEHLKRGITKSCGCLSRETSSAALKQFWQQYREMKAHFEAA